MSEFTEDDWKAVTNLEQESLVPGAKIGSRWSAFPLKQEPDRIFFYPDIHFPYHDVLFLEYLDAKCLEYNPTHIVILGDVLDCYGMSSFDKDPGRKETLNDERNAARKWLRKLRSAHPDATIIFIEGNHEERIFRQIKRFLPGLYDLPELSIQSLLSLDKLNIQHFDSHGFVGWGMRIKHGNSTAKWSSNAEMLRHRMSGISGHVHRKQEAQFMDAEGHFTIWRSLGHCCDMDQVEYVKGPNWTQVGGKMTVHPDGRQEWEYLEG